MVERVFDVDKVTSSILVPPTNMKILSIETSCDDTGITIMEATGGYTNASFKILSDKLNSQIKLHIPYGGVYPALAKREHATNLPILLAEALKESQLDKEIKKGKKPVDAIAVTYGPGLEMCLWEGIVFAKNLATKWNVPLIPTNHMEGHIFSTFAKKDNKGKGKFLVKKVKTPTLSLLVSGGHTELVVSKKWMEYDIVGQTLDDAVGEAYDKVARMLGLPYPGGPEISKLAEGLRTKEEQYFLGVSQADEPRGSAGSAEPDSDPEKIRSPFVLPRPMLHSKNFNFSFSGLKTAVLYLIKKLGGLEKIDEETKSKIALEFEKAAIESLVHKTKKAIDKYKIKTLIIGGGVSCNTHLRNEMQKLTSKKIKLLVPEKNLTGDNALMIGIAGYLNFIKNKKKVPKMESIKADGNLRL